MERVFVKVSDRGVLSIPARLRNALRLTEPGRQLELVARDDGVLELRPHVAVPADQAWFWTPEWQAKEREADEEAAAGKGTVHADGEALIAHLNALVDE